MSDENTDRAFSAEINQILDDTETRIKELRESLRAGLDAWDKKEIYRRLDKSETLVNDRLCWHQKQIDRVEKSVAFLMVIAFWIALFLALAVWWQIT
ncbi:MAG: hypothetical protein ACRC11_14295 [Xenococcaceae cyanobacterium]